VSRALLVLRPEPGASATAARAAALGLTPVVAPLFSVAPLPWSAPPPSSFDALLLTSANAVRHGGPQLARYAALPVYAVGAGTAAAAQAAGLTNVIAGDSDGAAMVARAAGDGVRRLLHLSGREHRASEHEGVTVERRIVYAAHAADALPDAAHAALAAGAVALLHSPRAAATFRALVIAAGLAPRAIRIAAISPAALAAAGDGWEASAGAASVGDDALLAAAARLCD
jgi:uroporphyrinogen-III synthase